jgi:signal peptide peptidase SppA
MKVIDVINSPWAIIPEKLVEIQEIYITHLRGEKIDLAAIEARLGRQLDSREKPYDVENGVGIIYVDGVIGKRMNAFSRISGGISSQLIARDLQAALSDPEVNSILLYVDSPGGAVDGTQELAQEIFRARGKKPIVAYTDGLMASAAYWIASAADPGRVFISGNTTQVGSIGVVARHIDVSKMEERWGIKTSEITAGRYKRIASQYAPLTESGRQNIQDMVDHIYSTFVNDVASFRGLDPNSVKQNHVETIPWADGRIFMGSQAIEAGLVDGVSTLAALIKRFGDSRVATRDKVERKIFGSIAAEEKNLPFEKRAQLRWNRSPELRQEFRMGGFKAYLAWEKNKQNVRGGRR